MTEEYRFFASLLFLLTFIGGMSYAYWHGHSTTGYSAKRTALYIIAALMIIIFLLAGGLNP